MQLLNSKILSNDKNTRYSNKKAQDTRVTCAFLSVVAFSYYKDGGDAGICLTAIVTEGQSRAAEGVHVAKQRHGFCRAKSPLRNKKRNSLRCSFFLVEMRGFEPRFILTRPIPSTRLVGDWVLSLQFADSLQLWRGRYTVLLTAVGRIVPYPVWRRLPAE